MEMHQVRYFLAVCETLNFTRAADHCGVAQPSLTRAIKKLEDELGGELFRRERSRTHLTDLGRLVKPHLESIYTASEAALVEAQDFQTLDKAPLRLGVMCTIGPGRLVGFFERLRRELPTLDLSLVERPGQQLIDEMMEGALDVALIGLPSFPDRLDTRPLYAERYVIGFPSGHRFESMSAVPLKELDREDYLLRVDCEFMDHFDELGLPKPFEVNVKYSSEREDWIQAMILAGMGCSVMPEYLPLLPGLGTRALIEPEVHREIRLVTVAGRRFSPAVRAVSEAARRHDWQAAA